MFVLLKKNYLVWLALLLFSGQSSLAQSRINWLGSWQYEDSSVEYQLKIDDKYRGMNLCRYTASGIQTYYELECWGLDKGNVFELYYRSTAEGFFGTGAKIDLNKPVLTLVYRRGQVFTYWNQLINNYVEQNNHSGQVCFTKRTTGGDSGIRTSLTGRVNDSDGYTNLRTQATTASAVKQRLYNGTSFSIVVQTGNWYQIRLVDGQTGYVHKSRVLIDE